MSFKLQTDGQAERGEVPQDWAEFLARLFEINYAFRPAFNVDPADPLCASHHFFASKIETIDWYDSSDHKHTITEFHTPPPAENVKRIVAKIKHLEIETFFSNGGRPEKIETRGQQYDVNSSDFEEANLAMMEKATQAMAAAYQAKAYQEQFPDWSEVNFGETTCPIERYMLKMACDRLGLNYGQEDTYTSVLGGVSIEPETNYMSSAYVQEMVKQIEKKGDNPNETDLISTSAQAAFNSYLETQPPVFPKDGSPQTHSVSSDVRPEPTHARSAIEQHSDHVHGPDCGCGEDDHRHPTTPVAGGARMPAGSASAVLNM